MPLRFSNKHADYDIVRVEHDRVFIIDLDLGNTSVTNDAEYVYLELQKQWPNRRVIYKDSMGRWDEIYVQKSQWNEIVIEYDFVTFKNYNEHTPQI